MDSTSPRSRVLAALMAVVAVVGLVAAGCGDDDDDGGTTTTAAAAENAGGDAGGDDTAGATAEVTIADFAFTAPDSVAVGTTLTITNNDSVPHTFTAEDGSFDTGSIAPGASAQVTLDTAGTVAYRCTIHPSMTGSITVE